MSRPAYSLSVVIPLYNGEGWIGRCIDHIAAAVHRAELDDVEVILVDDGSTDGGVAEARASASTAGPLPLQVISQPNLGRFRARLAGLQQAKGEYVLFIDTRVFLDENSLAYLAPLVAEPDAQVWTAHVEANTELSRIASFWQAIEHVAWRRYFTNPRRMSFGIDEFDYFPKGTTALFGPTALLLDAFESFRPTVADWRLANDDTAVLRWVAERVPINIAPDYRCLYNSRTTLPAFLRHSRHRGSVLIDGYLRRGTRFVVPIIVVLAATPVGIVWALRRPRQAVAAAVIGSVGAGAAARARGARSDDAKVLAVLAVPFGVSYLTGMWRGVITRVVALRSRTNEGDSCGS
jgi:Glycosyl transferase family 2